MPFGGTCFYYSVRFITSIAFCGFRAVLSTGCIIVGNVIRKTMSKRITACKSFRAFFAAFARIIIGCRFGAGCVGRLIFVRYNLFVKRMNMLILLQPVKPIAAQHMQSTDNKTPKIFLI